MNIRTFNFSDSDYRACAQVTNAAHPEMNRNTEALRYFDDTRGQDEVLGRFIVEEAGYIIGWAHYSTPRNPLPEALEVHYHLRPNYQHLSQALWDFLLVQLAPFHPKALTTRAREDWTETAFYTSQAFTEYDRMWASTLDVTTFNAKRFEPYLERSNQAGIHIQPLSEFPHTDDTFRRQWYDLMITLLRDVPSAEPIIPWSYETWLSRTPKSPMLLPEGYFFAIDNDEIIGVSELWKSSRSQTLQTGLTAIKQSHRRKGIAQTLKLEAAEFAKKHGFQFIRTNNHHINRPMLAINEAMGFVKEPAWVHLKKELS